jgi:hypothetical protein
MLVWDETDFIMCLEVLPVVDEHATSYAFSVTRDGLQLEVSIHPFDGDVCISLYRCGLDVPAFDVKLIDCNGVRYVSDMRGEYLEFAPAKCFGGRYDGLAPIPFGIRLCAKPHISIRMFSNPAAA